MYRIYIFNLLLLKLLLIKILVEEGYEKSYFICAYDYAFMRFDILP